MKIILTLMILAMLLSGCATRSYVRDQCYVSERKARAYSREEKVSAIDYADTIKSDLDQLKKTIMTSSEIRMEMYRDSYLKKIERLESEAIRLKEMIEDSHD